MQNEEFRKHAHEFVDWMADYFADVEKYPVKPVVEPGQILSRLPLSAPDQPESIDRIFRDFEQIILPGMTHWQSPGFFAYFPANNSYPSVLAEMLTATLGAQCMVWDTSPAAAELEERMMQWLRDMTGLPVHWEGVIQDTASTATLTSLLTARERFTAFKGNRKGLGGFSPFRVYGSTETHSSIEKAVKIAGMGSENFMKIPVDDQLRMEPLELEKTIRADLSSGMQPLAVVATLGTTGTTAIDDLSRIAPVCRDHGIWLHVDAAMAGTALLLPEYRWMIQGLEQADSFVFNPHKWMFTNFDCSAYFVRDRQALTQTFEILPEYLKTSTRGKVNDYRDWGIPLGRRFRALKLWFVIRSFGLKGLRDTVKKHIEIARELGKWVIQSGSYELMAPVTLNTVCFRYRPDEKMADEELDRLNEQLLQKLNQSGKMLLSHTRVRGKYTLRLVVGQTRVERHHVAAAWEQVKEMAGKLSNPD